MTLQEAKEAQEQLEKYKALYYTEMEKREKLEGDLQEIKKAAEGIMREFILIVTSKLK